MATRSDIPENTKRTRPTGPRGGILKMLASDQSSRRHKWPHVDDATRIFTPVLFVKATGKFHIPSVIAPSATAPDLSARRMASTGTTSKSFLQGRPHPAIARFARSDEGLRNRRMRPSERRVQVTANTRLAGNEAAPADPARSSGSRVASGCAAGRFCRRD
jgi:hypothetical protein